MGVNNSRNSSDITFDCNHLNKVLPLLLDIIDSKSDEYEYNVVVIKELLCKIFKNETDAIYLVDLLEILPSKYKNLIQIGKGSYGIIYNDVVTNDVLKVTTDKINYIDTGTRLIVSDKNKYLSAFIEENLTSVLLYYFHAAMITFDRFFPQPFPQIKKLYKDITDDNKLCLVSVMEKLDMNGVRFFKEIQNSLIVLKVLIQITYYLLCLQKAIHFTHGDFHPGNIMFKIEQNDIELYGESISSEYRPYIIDLGMACADLTKCCELPDIIIHTDQYKDNKRCLNKSQDLRLLFAALHFQPYPSLPTWLKEYLSKLFDPIERFEEPYHTKVFIDVFEESYDNRAHAFYAEVSEIDDPRFYPEIVILELYDIYKRYK